MARSKVKTVRYPGPIIEGLDYHRSNGTVHYEDTNKFLVGLARYQLIVGGSHPVTEAIARMPERDQDLIDDFLLECAKRGVSLRGQLLRHLIDGSHVPSDQDQTRRIPHNLLALARRWAAGSDVWTQIGL